MEDLSNQLDTVKANYREIFQQCFEEIRENLRPGYFENELLPYVKSELDNVKRSRVSFNCAGCGACCRFAVSEFSPSQLYEKAKSGDIFASQFVKTFIPYKFQNEAREVFPEYVDMLEKQANSEYYFYHCPKVTKDNRCPDYENRPQICRDFPDNPIAFLPKNCSFLPWKLKSEPVLLKLNAIMEIINFYKKELEEFNKL